jgi:hypothetical protein
MDHMTTDHKLRKFRWAVVAGAALGAAVPLLFFAIPPFRYFVATDRGIFLWPSAIWLMATDMEGRGYAFPDYVILGVSIFANVLLYSMVLSFAWCLGWVFRAWRGSLRDGTTI